MGYNDVLQLGHFLGTDVLISVGQLNQPSDWSMLVNWLSYVRGGSANYAASGHKIYLEDGNEAWNSGVGAPLYYGNGMAYGYTLGPNMAAAKSASGYNPKVIKLVANGWVAPNQGYGQFGWVHNVLTLAKATPNGLPDFVDYAPYMLNYLGNFNTSGVKVSTTGAPFLDEWAEIANVDSVITTTNSPESMYLNQKYVKSTFGVNTLVYEVNESTTGGVAATQTQLDQIDASVGNALAMASMCSSCSGIPKSLGRSTSSPWRNLTMDITARAVAAWPGLLCRYGEPISSWPQDRDRLPAAPIPTGRWPSLSGSLTMPLGRTAT